jgi:TPR repeat protein
VRVLGWIELRFRVLAAMARRDPARIWLRWAREAHHGDVALACLDRAMALGDADARFEHALLEAEGLFGAGEPAINLRRAAEQGHVEAMMRLADCLRWGPGRERDAAQAKIWLIRAAEAGFRPAAESLARWMEESG